MTTRPSSSIQWGSVTLHLTDPLFLKGYADGREYHFVSCVETPRRLTILAATDVLLLIATPDAQGHYYLDVGEPFPLEQRFGYVLGYLSGPILPDACAEIQAREQYCRLFERDLPASSLTAPSVFWGRVRLYLNHEAFREGYADGRACYFESCLDFPDYASFLTDESLLRTIAYPDGEHYHLDEEEQMAFDNALGFFVGYLSGPLLEQTPEERAREVQV
jgi:hypothetical protein